MRPVVEAPPPEVVAADLRSVRRVHDADVRVRDGGERLALVAGDREHDRLDRRRNLFELDGDLLVVARSGAREVVAGVADALILALGVSEVDDFELILSGIVRGAGRVEIDLVRAGFEIYEGSSPPDVEGAFYGSAFNIVYDDLDMEFDISPYIWTFEEQTTDGGLTASYESYTDTASGMGAFVRDSCHFNFDRLGFIVSASFS